MMSKNPNLYKKMMGSAKYIQAKIKRFKPELGLVLGSGLGGIIDKIVVKHRMKYSNIPHFPKTKNVKGHKGEFIFGKINGKNVVVMAGRFHAYQGFSLQDITLPVRVMAKLGVQTLIITNAAGGLNRNFKVGDLMIIKDHVNAIGSTPLVGIHDERLGVQFQPMTNAYDKNLIKEAKKIAKKQKIKLKEGVYVAVMGPTYETPAEVKMYKMFADAIGMSTVPEVIVANHHNIRVFGLSCITNVHDNKSVPSHEEVIEATNQASEKFENIISKMIKNL